ncbi:MAG TPA: hypothetical protein VK524_28000 [Polyangiaceae bacterium]|nr:hypothetical protein [Polyangiaceae bacterium]
MTPRVLQELRQNASRTLLRSGAVLACVVLQAACAEKAEKPRVALEPELMPYVFESVPSNIPNRTFIDFEGKVHVIGYSVEPEVATPGGKIKLTTYWQSVSPLRPGWSLFTHVLTKGGNQVMNVDNEGPLRQLVETEVGARQAWPPSFWEPGKVYVDQQEFQLDASVKSSEILLAVGIWKGMSRLAVISGPKDRANRGIVVRMKTATTKPAPSAAKT